MPDKSPKTIATINFKGGVGKTTVTWCLGDVLSSTSNRKWGRRTILLQEHIEAKLGGRFLRESRGRPREICQATPENAP